MCEKDTKEEKAESLSLGERIFYYSIVVPVFMLCMMVLFGICVIGFKGMSENKRDVKETKQMMNNYTPTVSNGKVEVLGSDGDGIRIKDLEDGLETIVTPSSIYGYSKYGVAWSVGDVKVVDRVHYLDKDTGKEMYRGYTMSNEGQRLIQSYLPD